MRGTARSSSPARTRQRSLPPTHSARSCKVHQRWRTTQCMSAATSICGRSARPSRAADHGAALMSQDEPWTIGRLLTWTTDYLKRQRAESPRLDAELLLAEACGCQRIEL